MSDKDLNNFEDTAEDLDEMFVTLTFDDGEEEECEVITIFEAKGRDYIALIPVETMDEEDSEIYFYRYKEDAEGNPSLENIEADDEYDMVVDAFDTLIEEADEED